MMINETRRIQGIALPNIALDIAAMLPHRCPNFIPTLHATIDRYFDEGDPNAPLTDADRLAISEAVIELKF